MLVVAAFGLVACEAPPPPPPSFVVNDPSSLSDAVPGDGTCEVTPGAGDCSLVAALDEANALGAADLVLPEGLYQVADTHYHVHLTVTGVVRINVGAPQTVRIDYPYLTVADGGVLHAFGVTFSQTPIWVQDGTALLQGSDVVGLDTAVAVDEGGTFVAQNTVISSGFSRVIENLGTVVLRSSTVDRLFGDAAISTDGSGVTTLASTAIVTTFGFTGPSVACMGTAPVSDGYNTAYDTSCGLTGVGDVEGVVLGVEPVSELWGTTYLPTPGSPMVDAIPEGANGCGTAIAADRIGQPRPFDGDGTPACDIGAFELQVVPDDPLT